MDLRALVVSPDQESTNLLTLILSELGVATEITASIQGGLKLLEQQRFDTIILDYRGGEECASFLQHLRQCPKSSIGILIVIVDSDFNPRPLFGLGANFILYRPLSSERTRISLRAARPLMRRERRRAPRIPVAATVKVAYPGAPELNATLQDLSADGTSLETPEPLPAECKVYF
jgi:DNA-binding response OmpR family regulator